MTPSTKAEIKKLNLDIDQPLLIIDADEVLVLFAEHFRHFLKHLGWSLKLKGYRLDDAIVNIKI